MQLYVRKSNGTAERHQNVRVFGSDPKKSQFFVDCGGQNGKTIYPIEDIKEVVAHDVMEG